MKLNITRIVAVTAELAKLNTYYERCQRSHANSSGHLSDKGISYAKAAMRMTETTMNLQKAELVELLK